MAGVLSQIKVGVLNLLPRSWMTIKSNQPGTVCLTYDDGPYPEITPRLLDLLKERNARATFFVLGRNAKAHPDIVKRIAAEGHTLGNHSYFHNMFHTMPLAAQMKEIRDTNALLEDITGQPCTLFRAPSGKLSSRLFRSLVSENITYANWSRDTLDYSLDEQDVVAGLMQRPIRDRDIVLMHDDHQKAIGITDHILSQYSNYRFTAM